VTSALSPALAPLWRAVHARLSDGRAVSRVRLGPLTVEQRGALADLLGLARLPGEHTSVALVQLDNALREAVGVDTLDVVTELVGPVGDRAGERRRVVAERAELWAWLAEQPFVTADWVAGVRRGGLIDGSVSRTRDVLERVLRVVERLPAAGVPLSVFADDVLGETHALDEGKRCAGLVLRALAAIYDVPPPTDARQRRALWERAGVAEDELSSTVIVAGFRADGDDVVSRILQVCAAAGEAAVLTLRQLRGGIGVTGPDAWVFENPSVVALALARFGDRCPPIVCTSGWPSSAGILLLRSLSDVGTRLHYHGDFDGEGLRIAANVVARTGALPWRMGSADYLAAVADGPPVGRVTDVPWDADLAGHLVRVGTTVPEERVAPALLDEIG
jgi:uncharacterized protein (TIGR02679 family)